MLVKINETGGREGWIKGLEGSPKCSFFLRGEVNQVFGLGESSVWGGINYTALPTKHILASKIIE